MEAFWILAIFYAALILFFWLGLLFTSRKQNSQLNSISIIVAARDEAANLPNLLPLLIEQNYPDEFYEIIIADDRSQDDTSDIVQRFKNKFGNLKLIRIDEENPQLVGKKGAVTAAVKLAQNDILAFTDADCLPTLNWLREINAHFTEDTDFIAGYSIILHPNGFFNFLKNLERSAFFAVIASAFTFNWGISVTAGNMAYRRRLFSQIKGFAGIGHIRSGDDDLLLHKIRKLIRNFCFMFSQDSIVLSKGCQSAVHQINQETRRGSKWRYYPLDVKLITSIVMLFYLSYIILFFGCLTSSYCWILFLRITLFKIIPEFLLIFTFLYKIKKMKFLSIFPIAELLYIPYFIFFGIKGTIGKYKWKE